VQKARLEKHPLIFELREQVKSSESELEMRRSNRIIRYFER
jgi:hypothetical protein